MNECQRIQNLILNVDSILDSICLDARSCEQCSSETECYNPMTEKTITKNERGLGRGGMNDGEVGNGLEQLREEGAFSKK